MNTHSAAHSDKKASAVARNAAVAPAGAGRRRPFQLVLPLLLVVIHLATLSGCRVVHTWCGDDVTPMTEKTTLQSEPDNTKLDIVIPFIPNSELGSIPDFAGGDANIEPLTLREVEVLAARHSPTAKILQQESGSGVCQCDGVDPQITQAINQAVNSNADYQRNLVAEQAMLAYFGLAEVYLQNSLSRESESELKNLQTVLEGLQSENLLREVDPEMLVRENLASGIDRQELIFNYRDLNQKLRALLGLNESQNPIWTSCQIDSWQPPADLEAEIQLAIENRRDLESIRGFVQVGNDQLFDLLQSAVRTVSPFAAFRLRQRRLFGGLFRDESGEIQKVRKQLAILHESQIELTRSRVKTQFFAIEKQYQLVQLYRKQLESFQKSEQRLDVQRKVGPVKVEDVLRVKTGILKSRSSLIHAAVQLQMEWVKLKARQGLLGVGATESATRTRNGYQ